jgi:outer membrane immunogenic protein
MTKTAFAALAVSAGIVFGATAAQAADPYADPAYDWSGVGLGIHAGYGWGDVDVNYPNGLPSSSSNDVEGGMLGLHVNYNYQNGNFVMGPELGLTWSGIDGTGGTVGTDEVVTNDINWLGNANLRFGLAQNDWLFFLSGGVSAGEVDAKLCSAAGISCVLDPDVLHVGWNIGAGLEKAVNQNLILGLEYRYIDLGQETHDGTNNFGEDVAFLDHKVDVDLHTVMARLTWKF